MDPRLELAGSAVERLTRIVVALLFPSVALVVGLGSSGNSQTSSSVAPDVATAEALAPVPLTSYCQDRFLEPFRAISGRASAQGGGKKCESGKQAEECGPQPAAPVDGGVVDAGAADGEQPGEHRHRMAEQADEVRA